MLRDLFQLLHRLDPIHIGVICTALLGEIDAADGFINTIAVQICTGAEYNHKVRRNIVPDRLDLGTHQIPIDDFVSGGVAGGENLVINLQASCSQLLIHGTGVGCLNGIAKSVVRVRQQRRRTGRNDVLNGSTKLRQAQKAKIGTAQHTVGQCSAGQKQGRESRLLCDLARQAVIYTRQG